MDSTTGLDQAERDGAAVSDPAPIGRGLQSFVQDPDGNVVELHQAA
ncbi:VOC family protein [Nocardia arthritidis]|uniref:VOC domain-containing protein n=1 Tax=Nocardia arthritidis TaxID=228602 RepID=A0A6G9YHA2_9NOCA|nr:hypothetical protein [Nocardia arthritidis]QIS12343.1 hypothetical protein F5544_22405 [Nocardia arthritidis]